MTTDTEWRKEILSWKIKDGFLYLENASWEFGEAIINNKCKKVLK
jgi:hypothetical protein